MARSLNGAALLFLLLVAAPANAQTAGRKFLRGLAGMTTPFLVVPGNMVAETRTRGAAEGIPFGFAKGLGMIIPRVFVGVWEFLSAPFPAPPDFRPIIEPEFPWGYFESQPAKAPPPPPPPPPRHRPRSH